MSKLVIFAHQNRELRDDATELFACTLSNELNFTRRTGEPILIANIGPPYAIGHMALGRLTSFHTEPSGMTFARVEHIRNFLDVVPLSDAAPTERGLSEIPDETFKLIIERATHLLDVEESSVSFDAPIPLESFSRQLARQQNGHCSFSDVFTAEGAAHIIRPLDRGGAWHAKNFLFLDPEPGQLFSTFAWTVGPRLEILIDTYVVRPDIADTVNRTGMLAINDKLAAWPERDDLAWHRQQFFDRLRG